MCLHDVLIFSAVEVPLSMVGNTMRVQGRVTGQKAPAPWKTVARPGQQVAMDDRPVERFEDMHEGATLNVGTWSSSAIGA